MDKTILFKACVKTVRTTNKALGLKDTKTNILRSAPKDLNLTKPKEIVKQISNLQQIFEENKLAYLNVINYLSTNETMTEADRQEIDSIARIIIGKCATMIKEYRQEIAKLAKSKQADVHYQNVIDTVERYLKTISKMYAEAKAIRVKKVIDTHKLSKLEYVKPNRDEVKVSKDVKSEREIAPPTVDNIDDQLSAEEIQMFESENQHLYSELNSLSDEVKQMETKVVHIAELQELFTEKVLQQEKDIERIATTVTGTTEDMKMANDQIRQAIQRNAGLRVWVLFFLLVMSFSLLFLDWYND